MYMAPMVDMAIPNDANDGVQIAMPTAAPKAPRYPYGLCIRMTDDDLKKVGLDGDRPEYGEMIHLFAMAKVTCVSETGIELQITHLATENEDQENAAMDAAVEKDDGRRKRFYPTMDAAGDDPGE